MKDIRYTIRTVLAVAALAALAVTAGAGVAAAAGGLAAYNGKVVNLRESPPSSLDAKDMADWVKENRVTGRAQTSPGEWTLNIFTVFKTKPGMPKVMLLLYDKKDPESIKKREPIEAEEITVPPDATLFTTTVTITEGMGFNSEHKYLIRFVAATSKTERILSEGEIALVKSAP
jgi:hypothetical protein